MQGADALPILWLLALNALAALAVFAYGLFQVPGRRGALVLTAWFILICPLASLLFLTVSHGLNTFRRIGAMDMEDVKFNKEREQVVLPPDSHVELNYVPLGDAMAVTDAGEVRKLLIDILKGDNPAMMTSVARAIDSADTEVSHYAAAAILDLLSDFRANLQRLLLQMQKYPDNVQISLDILEYLYRALRMNIMNDSEQRAKVQQLDEVGENLFAHNLWYMRDEHYLWLTDMLISVGAHEQAEKWARRAWKYTEGQLNAYKARLHVYYATGQTEAFFECIAELKHADVVVDKEVLDMLRIYG